MFYTYAHIRKSDGKYFYIGKGHDSVRRNRSHEMKGRSQHHKNVVAKHGLIVEILAYWKDEQDAFDHEKLLISCFRDMGHPLVNQTDGGEGVVGLKHSEESRKRHSIAATKRWYSHSPERVEEIKRNISKVSKISNSRPDVKEKISESMKKHWQKPGTKEKLSLSVKEMLSRPGMREKIAASAQKTFATKEFKEMRSNATKKIWENYTEEEKISIGKKISAANKGLGKGRKLSQETRNKMTIAKKLWWENATPEQIAERSRKRKETIAAKRSKQ